MGILDFFSQEAGQRRTRARDEAFDNIAGIINYYLGPTGVPAKAQAAANALEYTDAGDMPAAADASRQFMRNPTLGNAAELTAAGIALGLPMYSARLGQGIADVADDMVRAYDPNRVNIFAGAKAQNADLGALERAQKMAADGADRGAIWDNTGWFQGVDGKWRFEVDDSGIGLRSMDETQGIADGMRDEAKGILAGISERNADLKVQPDLFPRELRAAHGDLRRRAADLKAEAGSNFGPDWHHTTVGQRANYAVTGPLDGMYPDAMRDTIVRTSQPGGPYQGSYNGSKSQLEVTNSARDERSTLLHELQHMVQGEEGFARGSNPDEGAALAREAVHNASIRTYDAMKQKVEALPDDVKRAFEQFREDPRAPFAREAFGNMGRAAREVLQLWDQSNTLSRKAAGVKPRTAHQFYRRSAGETEARNVQSRMNMSPSERRASPPWETQDIPETAQMVRYGDIAQSSAPSPDARHPRNSTNGEVWRHRSIVRAITRTAAGAGHP